MRNTRTNGSIQGLRAVAVISVIAYHLKLDFFRFGYLGVDVFFVLSGYLIFRITSVNGEFPKKYILSYLKNRVRRIAPALLFNIILAVPFVYFFTAPYLHDDIRMSLVATFFSVANVFYFLNTNYFNSINDSAPFLHFWSISLEIQFYLSAPFIILGALRSKAPKFLIFTLIIMSLILSSIYMYRNDAASFYLLPMRLWEFLIGGLVFLLNKKDFSRISTNTIIIVRNYSFTLIIVAMSTSVLSSIASFANIFICVCTSIILFQVERNSRNGIYSSPPMIFVGDISYSLYLSHFIVFFLFENYFVDNEWGLISLSLSIFFTILVSLFSYYVIEKPFLTSQLRSSRALVTWVVVVSCLVLGSNQLLFGTLGEKIWLKVRTEPEQQQNFNLISKYTSLDLSTNRVMDGACIYYSAQLGEEFKSKFQNCTQDGRKALIIFGDSHAMNLHNVYAQSNPESVIFTLAEGGCRPNEKKSCFYRELIPFAHENSNRISKMIYHQSGSHLLQSLRGMELTAKEYNGSYDFRVNSVALSKVNLYLNEMAFGTSLIWLGPYLEPQLDFRNPENWKSRTSITDQNMRKFETLDTSILKKSEKFGEYQYVSSLNRFRFPFDRIFHDDCLAWSDFDHLSTCGESLLSVLERDFLVNLVSSNDKLEK